MARAFVALVLAWAVTGFLRRQAGHDLALRTLVLRQAAADDPGTCARLREPALVIGWRGAAAARALGVDALHPAAVVGLLLVAGAHVHEDDLRGRVGYALDEARGLQQHVDAFHAAHGRFPGPAEAGADAARGFPAGGGYRLVPGGAIRIHFSVLAELRDGRLTLTPAARAGGGVDWTCSADGRLARYAPAACRGPRPG